MIKLPQDQYVDVDGLKVRYWQLGESGPQLLLVHGIGACAEYWYKNVFALSEHYRVLAFDLPGFGKSDKPNVDYTIDFYDQFINRFCEVMNYSSFVLVGHSLGGGISLKFAIDHRDKVEKLVLIDAVGFSKQVVIFFRLMGMPIIGRFFLKVSKKLFSVAFRQNVYDKQVISEELIDIVYPLSQSPLAIRTMANITKHNTNILGIKPTILQPLWDGMPTLQDLPVLIYWGLKDELLRANAHVPAAKAKLPNASFHLMDECGHIPQLEFPDVFKHVLDEFIEHGRLAKKERAPKV